MFTICLFPYVVWLIFSYQYHIIDGANLLFHEAGHLFFGFFGETIQFMGGTIGQLIFPIACTIGFINQEKGFEAGVTSIWIGENLMNIAAYVNDAEKQELPLVGGGIHDWNWLLSNANMIEKCESIASIIHVIASIIVVLSLAYIVYVTFIRKQYPISKNRGRSGIRLKMD